MCVINIVLFHNMSQKKKMKRLWNFLSICVIAYANLLQLLEWHVMIATESNGNLR